MAGRHPTLPTAFARFAARVSMSWRLLLRDARSGELGLLAVALVIAAGSTSTVGFFADRVQRGLEAQSASLLGGDRLLVSTRPQPPTWQASARRLGLNTTRTVDFRSVVLAAEPPAHGTGTGTAADTGSVPQLVEVKAVEAGYPLRGQLHIAEAPFIPGRPTARIPAPGTVWVAGRLLPRLGLKVGDYLNLGAARLRIAAVLSREPDRAGDLFSLAPRVLMNRADLPTTQLLSAGSRAQYRLLLAGPAGALQRFHTDLLKTATASEQGSDQTSKQADGQTDVGFTWRSSRNARPELRQALDRAHRFLGLTALVSVLLAGLVVVMVVRRFVRRHLDAAAVLRSLGADRRHLLTLFGLEMLWLGLAAGLLGALLGLAAQAGLHALLGRLLLATLPPPGLTPLFSALGVALITLLGFGLPPLLGLLRVPPARVLRRELAPPPPRAWLVYGLALAGLGAIAAWQIGEPQLLGWFLSGAVLTLAALAAAGALVLVLLRALRRGLDSRATALTRHWLGHAAHFGLNGLLRHPRTSLAQVLALGLGLMALLLLSLVRNDLLAGWERSLPANTPNYFLINVQPDQVQALRDYLSQAGLHAPRLYPMVRGRLRAINGQPVRPEAYPDPRARRLATREFNLSWSERPQRGNRIVAGHWWSTRTGPATPANLSSAGTTDTAPSATSIPLSLETGIARTLGIKLGDTLRFEIAGQPLTVRVSNLRQVEWDTFRVNFFAVMPPGVLDRYPATWITSFYLPPARQGLLAPLVARFPNVTVIDVAALLGQVQQLIGHVTLAVQYLFGFTLLAGLAVLYAALQAQQDERRYEAALLRTLGARRRLLIAALIIEFTALGALAGLLAGLAASAIGQLLAQQVFHFTLGFTPRVALAGMLLGALAIGLAGVLGTRKVWHRPPLRTLSENIH